MHASPNSLASKHNFSDTGQVIATDIINTVQGGGGGGQPATPVAEPGALVLFGTGLLGPPLWDW